MTTPMICNSCSEQFTVTDSSYHVLERDGLTVKYFSCPACGRKYHVITINDQMQQLIDQRKALQKQIIMGQKKHFREKTLREYIAKLDAVKRKQRILFAELKAKGEQLLHDVDEAVTENG